MRAVRVDAIQVLRLFAALLVVIDHGLGSFIRAGVLSLEPEFAWIIGGYGVKIFFLISGFVMVHSMVDRFGTPHAPRDFLIRRTVRIAPIYWLVSLLVVIKGFVKQEPYTWQEILASVLFLPYAGSDGDVKPIYGVGWTLNYEMLFYAAFAVCLLFRRAVGLPLLFAAMLTLVALGQLGWVTQEKSLWGDAARFWTDSIQLFFVCGLLLGLWRVRLERAGAGVHLPLEALTVFILVGIAGYITLLYHGLGPMLLQFAFCVVIVAVCGLINSEARTPLMLQLRELGDASYSIYLTHGFVYPVLAKLWIAKLPQVHVSLFLALAIVVCSFVGLLTYRWVERPMLRYLQGVFTPRRTEMRAAPAGG